jgi:hypothetical protein
VADQDRGSDDPRLAAAARHALHDEELVAAFAAGDLEDPAEAERARSMVERCTTCRELHGDLMQIRIAVQSSGSAAQRAATLAAPRDFRLTAEDAARLRPGSPIARLGARLGWRGLLRLGIATVGRPVGAGLVTLGIVGLLVGSLALSGGPFALSAGAPAASSASGGEGTGPLAAATAGATERSSLSGPPATAKDDTFGSAGTPAAAPPPAGPIVLAGSVVALVVGIALVVASRRALRPISAGKGN